MRNLAAACDRAIDEAAELALFGDVGTCPLVAALQAIAERACGGDGRLGVRRRGLFAIPNSRHAQLLHGRRELEDAVAEIVEARTTSELMIGLTKREQFETGGDMIPAIERARYLHDPFAAFGQKFRRRGWGVSGQGAGRDVDLKPLPRHRRLIGLHLCQRDIPGAGVARCGAQIGHDRRDRR
ncbi:hypothetical protein [Bradyrhizobium sp. DASA03007]|uniref:hypothetical protein n=1 Tax=unclassified Bradyrhizobium TaxID=2631580 RepID=UPI003F6F8AD1